MTTADNTDSTDIDGLVAWRNDFPAGGAFLKDTFLNIRGIRVIRGSHVLPHRLRRRLTAAAPARSTAEDGSGMVRATI